MTRMMGPDCTVIMFNLIRYAHTLAHAYGTEKVGRVFRGGVPSVVLSS